ncbi:unnamed protein product [marine sediment metagenome]|uniref:Uncharacterized protein n=1 Tax=marine sediment metagenome TaxID=412755 RepID=X0XDH6_9ZZZZ
MVLFDIKGENMLQYIPPPEPLALFPVMVLFDIEAELLQYIPPPEPLALFPVMVLFDIEGEDMLQLIPPP